MSSIREEHATCLHLPGRDWKLLIGPENMGAQNLIFGICDFPVGSRPRAHVPSAEEEIIFVLEGQGAIVFPDHEENLDPEMAVFIPPGLEHRIEVRGQQMLKFISFF